ncbi:MAG: carbohydrate ABC transporter permease [Treponema sp.]|jgi:putative aldouronate transport system permease protein|nr:carbohydrate ABC transporter permease [Treponema sp.]
MNTLYPKRRRKTRLHRFTAFDFVIYGIMLFSLAVCLIPFLNMFALSFSSTRAIYNGQVGIWPVDFSIEAYDKIFHHPSFFRSYGNTLFYTSAGTFISLFSSVIFAYPLSKFFLRGHALVMKMVVFTMFFAGGLIPNYLLITSLGMSNTPLAILIPGAISAYNLIILISFFKGLPSELEDAALIDGLGYYGILFRIVVPLSGAVLATIGLFCVVGFWNDWFSAMLYLKQEQYPVMLYLRSMIGGVATDMESTDRLSIGIALKAAVILVSSLPLIILYPVLQRFFVSGLTIGSLKG